MYVSYLYIRYDAGDMQSYNCHSLKSQKTKRTDVCAFGLNLRWHQ
jgi:hypothetical protein